MSAIYRKYRPQVFNDVTGQDHIIKAITNEIATNKVAHAYLFSGPRGTGKTTLARLLAKAVNCRNRTENEYEPCNNCSSCQELIGGHSIDIIEVDAASHTGVDNVRENIIENAQFKPTKSKYKVFIIDEVHMLSTSAFNALLKTLEEPPAHAIFILATTEMHKLPATIISRCQRFNFKKVGYDDMMKRLEYICKQEKIKVEKKVLERIINKSDGCVRDAESLLGQIFSLDLSDSDGKVTAKDAEMVLPTSNIESILEFIDYISEKQPGPAVDLIGALVTDGVNLEQFTYDAIEALRLALIIQANAQTKNINTDYSDTDLKSLKKISEKIDSRTLIRVIESLIGRHREIKSAPLPQLPLELFAIEFGMADSDLSLRASTQSGQGDAAGTEVKDASKSKSLKSEDKGSFDSAAAPLRMTDETVTIALEPGSITKSEPHSLAQTIKETISHITRPTEIKTTLEDIKNKWDRVIEEVAKTNHSLSFILKMGNLQAIQDGQLHMTVPYSFHKDKIDEVKVKRTIEQTLADFFSERILVTCAVAESVSESGTDELDLTKLAADFGGEVA